MYLSSGGRKRDRRFLLCSVHGDRCDPRLCPAFRDAEESGIGAVDSFGSTAGVATKYKIDDSDRGTEATVDQMAALVRATMNTRFAAENAERIIGEFRPRIERGDYLSEIKALFQYAQGTHPRLRGLRYFKDVYHAETLQHPKRTEEWGGGDCDDLTTHLSGHLLARRYGPVRIVVVAADAARDDEFSHVYLHVAAPDGEYVDELDGSRWIPLDPTVGFEMGWEVPDPFRKAYFEVSR